MNQSRTAILVDSGCDIPEDFIKRYDIRVVRLKIIYKGKIYDDETEIGADYIYDHFSTEIPKTSTPNVFEINEIIEKIKADGYENIIGIAISGAMSGTCATMGSVLDTAEGVRTYMFDTKNISIGSGLQAMWAAKLLDEGASFEEVVAELQKRRSQAFVGFYMDTLDYLKAGGRITPSVALVGKMLNLKPIIGCTKEGVYYTIAKIRGQSRAVNKLIETMITDEVRNRKCWLALLNGRGADLAEKAKSIIAERFPDVHFILEKQIVPSMAIHTGPGLLGIGLLFID